MELNNHQGWYGETFVAAIAAASGFQVAVPYPDIGKDLILGRNDDDDDPDRDVQIALQVKSRRVDQLDGSGDFRVVLTREQYKRLYGRRQVPVYLVLVVVPRDPKDYAVAEPGGLRLYHSAYWVSLRHLTPLPRQNGQGSVTVTVPRDNLLTGSVLHDFFDQACEEVASDEPIGGR
ncbi:DUF4365 domain-containing protein [Streptomyces sp. NPDC051561]|uniref:DUF4365 domain-containing protein n=1 Tax=Streptomyces sp. NPDC051561 TaxID=3365658 RepID=UPI003799D6CF